MFFCRLLLTIFKINFSKTLRVSNGLDPDQDQCSVSPDLGPNCLQILQRSSLVGRVNIIRRLLPTPKTLSKSSPVQLFSFSKTEKVHVW